MKVKCPECKEEAQLEQDCSCVKCERCELDMDFVKYVLLAAGDDPASSDLLLDYDENAEGKSADHLDEWV